MTYSSTLRTIARNVFTKRVIVAATLLAATTALYSQDQKIGFVASEAIFSRLPAGVEARGKLGELQAKWTREIRAIEGRIALLKTEIEQNRLLWSSQERSRKEGELKNLQAELDDVRRTKFGPNGDFEKAYSDLMRPVVDIVMAAVQTEAEENGFDFVFDKSTRGLPLLVSNKQFDLTYGVLTRLGVTVDPSELESEEEKPKSLLPGNLPFKIETEESRTIKIDPTSTLPTMNPSEGMEFEQTIEVNPNELIDPDDPR